MTNVEMIALVIWLLLLVAVTAWVGFRWRTSQSKEVTLLFGFLVLLTTLFFAVPLLNLRVSAAGVSIEKARQEVSATKKEVARIAELALKSAYIVAEGSGRVDGFPKEFRSKLDEIGQELGTLTGLDLPRLKTDVEKFRLEFDMKLQKGK